MPKIPDNSFSIPAFWYQLKEDEILEQYEVKQKKAIKFLYYKFNDYFARLIKDFLKNEFKTKSGYTLKKINKKLTYLVSELEFFL